MKMFILVDCTKYELPIDVALSLKQLSIKHSIPYQTLKNRLCDGKRIKYINCRVISVNVPKNEF